MLSSPCAGSVLLGVRPEVLAQAAAVASLRARGTPASPLLELLSAHGISIPDDEALRTDMTAALSEFSRACADTPSVAEASRCASRPSSAISDGAFASPCSMGSETDSSHFGPDPPAGGMA